MSTRRGFTVLELLITIGVIALLLALVLPWLLRTRGSSRIATCKNHLMQIGVALQNYHTMHLSLPARQGGPHVATDAGVQGRWSTFIALGPHLGDPTQYEDLMAALEENPSPENEELFPWSDPQRWMLIPVVARCPSVTAENEGFPGTNYAFCSGDAYDQGYQAGAMPAPFQPEPPSNPLRGVFGYQTFVTFEDIVDGQSYTLLASELAPPTIPGGLGSIMVTEQSSNTGIEAPASCSELFLRDEGRFAAGVKYLGIGGLADAFRGEFWFDGLPAFAGINTILPPNSPTCMQGARADGTLGEVANDATAFLNQQRGYFSASSRHPGGVNALFGDGRVLFINEDIDAGDQTADPTNLTGESPFGVWGSMGTRAGHEPVEEF